MKKYHYFKFVLYRQWLQFIVTLFSCPPYSPTYNFKNPGAIYILEQAVKKLFYLADFALFVLLSPVKQEEINA